MKKIIIAFSLFCIQQASAQDTVKTDAKLISATVYFGYGAELTHDAKVNVNSNIKEIVINQLSTSIDPNSLQISVPEHVALLSHKFALYYPPVPPAVINPLIKKLQDSLNLVLKESKRNQNLLDIEAQTLDKTGRLIEITINNTGNKTISADDALKLINAYTAKIEKSKTIIFNLNEIRDQLNERISAFQTKINEAGETPVKAAKPYGQLTLQVICSKSGEIPVSLSYFTSNAGWTPLYDIRVNSKNNDIKLVYKASVAQSTGIDWKQTKLTLSTGNPSWGGAAPILNAWYLQLYVPQLYNATQKDMLYEKVANTIPSTYNNDDNLKKALAGRVAGVQVNESIDPSTLQNYTTLSESQLNTNYEIDLPYNIESDGQVHSVTIKEEKITANLKNYAVPKLDKDAYLLAEVADWQNLNLLPGTANIIMDNTYLGKSFIDANSTADTLNLSLGKDRRVAIKRSVIKDFTSTKTNGNTTKQTFTYELTVKNNKTTEVDLVLKDQYPMSTEKDIEVKLESSDGAAINEDIGVLTWKLKLKPGESKKLRFSYYVKYPKDKKIANL